MEDEVVVKRKWLTREYFLDMIAATHIVPGPNAVEMAIHIGYIHYGYLGLFAAGLAFLIPATTITLIIALIYVNYGKLPELTGFFYGISPAILAIIFVSGFRLGKAAIKSGKTFIIALLVFIAYFYNIDELVLILASGIGQLLFDNFTNTTMLVPLIIPTLIHSINNCFLVINDRLIALGLFFLKVGSILFGGGYVLFAYVHKDIVNNFHWLNNRQLLDAIAVGQMTPGPFSSAATFIGYLIEGFPGAIVSTIAMFIPSFVIVFFLGKWLPNLQKMKSVRSILTGINACVVSLIVGVAISLIKPVIVDTTTLLILLISLILLIKIKIDPIYLVISSGFFGLLLNTLTTH
jgi:chromate transporter